MCRSGAAARAAAQAATGACWQFKLAGRFSSHRLYRLTHHLHASFQSACHCRWRRQLAATRSTGAAMGGAGRARAVTAAAREQRRNMTWDGKHTFRWTFHAMHMAKTRLHARVLTVLVSSTSTLSIQCNILCRGVSCLTHLCPAGGTSALGCLHMWMMFDIASWHVQIRPLEIACDCPSAVT